MGERIDHYQIMRPLGRGGASHVYLAQDWHALQEVVLKFPDDDVIGGTAVFERYKREADIGRRLSHQYIQRHLNQGERRSSEYLVLEYMRGRTLREVVEKRAPGILPTGEVLRMLIQVCCALAYAHEHGVIHRDIKPENMMLLENGDIKIFDFGIALLEGERHRTWRGFSSPIGTPDYMAPERLLGAQISTPSGWCFMSCFVGGRPLRKKTDLLSLRDTFRTTRQAFCSSIQYSPLHWRRS